MIELQSFVDAIKTRIESIRPADFVQHGQHLDSSTAILLKLRLDELSRELASLIGSEKINLFFAEYEPRTMRPESHLIRPLATVVPQCCRNQSGHIQLDTTALLEYLSRIVECINTGAMDFTIRLRVTNVDFEDDFELAEGVHFHKLSPETVTSRYPLERQFTSVSTWEENHWLNHRAEVVIPKRGKPAELQQLLGIRSIDALTNSIRHTFILANLHNKSRPCVTHVMIDSPIEQQCMLMGQGGMSNKPPLLAADDIHTLRKAYSFLMRISSDRILETAVDRFLVGKKQDEHHPNRVNEPNWDKIVDYVIAMETLFLTIDGLAANQELKYRFSLNGASLLRICTASNVKVLFHALKNLYDIRSTVVHGGSESKILKAADRFITCLDSDSLKHKHSLGRLHLSCKIIEEWLTKVFYLLWSMPFDERPFRKQDGWEELLWSRSAEPVRLEDSANPTK